MYYIKVNNKRLNSHKTETQTVVYHWGIDGGYNDM
jgi:hypothetical protein